MFVREELFCVWRRPYFCSRKLWVPRLHCSATNWATGLISKIGVMPLTRCIHFFDSKSNVLWVCFSNKIFFVSGRCVIPSNPLKGTEDAPKGPLSPPSLAWRALPAPAPPSNLGAPTHTHCSNPSRPPLHRSTHQPFPPSFR